MTVRRYRIEGAARTLLLAVLLGALCPLSRAAAGPKLEISPQKMDFGSMRQGEKQRKVFLLRNTGDEALVIDQARASCTECIVDQKATYRIAPGEQAEMPVTYQATTVPGKYTAHVTLHTNDPAELLKRVFLEVQITERGETPFVELDPGEVNLGLVPLGEPVRRVLKIRNTGKAALRLDEVAPGPLVEVQARPAGELAPGAETEIALQVRSVESGIVRTNVTIATNDPEHPTVTAPIFGYAASAQEVGRLARGVLIACQPPDGGRASVRVTNNQQAAVTVSAAGAHGPLALAPGESGTLEAGPGSDSLGRLLLEIQLGAHAGAPRAPERKEQ